MSTAKKGKGYCILIADDDIDDQYMIRQAFTSIELDEYIHTVSDGMELLDYLYRKGKYKDADILPPKIILLDLNMPKKDGRECLKEIKSNPKLSSIPIIIYSTSSNPDDISYAYGHGASSYITKPYSYQELVKIMDVFKQYWFNVVKTSQIGL
ncbi:MAG: response regulator receiver protein [Bacteroidetes bacterium]|jgi:CheY-like chemotaxis protein|nr:response regulator receiver protein [Bacteroidota bacterium]